MTIVLSEAHAVPQPQPLPQPLFCSQCGASEPEWIACEALECGELVPFKRVAELPRVGGRCAFDYGSQAKGWRAMGAIVALLRLPNGERGAFVELHNGQTVVCQVAELELLP